MSARTRRYVMALKPGAEAMPDLKDRLARMPDVAVLGQSPRQVQVEATPEAAADACGRRSRRTTAWKRSRRVSPSDGGGRGPPWTAGRA